MRLQLCLTAILVSLMALPLNAQEEKKEADHKYKPLTLKLSDDGKKYIRFITWHQLWLSTGTNPGVSSSGPGWSYTVRRSRFLAFTQISPKFMIMTHFGFNSLGPQHMVANPNSQTANNRAVLFMHDLWGEFQIVPKKLYIGSGLHYWNGISRLSNQSTLNLMTIDNHGLGTSDARLFPWATITQSDQFARHVGIYAKGSLGNFGYRVNLNNARRNIGTLSTTTPTYQVAGDGGAGAWNFGGYFKYDIFDKEGDKLPYFVGTYLGGKKVLSIGAGFFLHPDAVATGTASQVASAAAGNSVQIATLASDRKNVSHIAADVFYDAPINESLAINALGAYYSFNFGDDKFASGGLVPSTGTVIVGQLGLLLRKAKLMPYVTYHTADFKSTPNTSDEFTVGAAYFVNGHFAKLNVEYTSGTRGTTGAESTNIFRIQMHVFL